MKCVGCRRKFWRLPDWILFWRRRLVEELYYCSTRCERSWSTGYNCGWQAGRV